jgi:hypothetical protein
MDIKESLPFNEENLANVAIHIAEALRRLHQRLNTAGAAQPIHDEILPVKCFGLDVQVVAQKTLPAPSIIRLN